MAPIDTIPLFIATSIVLFSLSYFIGLQVLVSNKTLEHLNQKGMLSNEWKPIIEYLAYKPKSETKPKDFIKELQQVKETVKSETSQITTGILAKLDPPVPKQSMKNQVMDIVKTTMSTPIQKPVDKPNMYVKKGYGVNPNPLEQLPSIVAAPFYACETIFDKSTDVAAGTISLFVISPLRISKQAFAVITSPFLK